MDAAGPINNVLVVRPEIDLTSQISSNLHASSRKQGSYLTPPLEKYANSKDEDFDVKTVISPSCNTLINPYYAEVALRRLLVVTYAREKLNFI